MFTFRSLEFITFISNFFWPMVRILSFFSIAPIFSDKLINIKSKIILSMIISFLIFPFLPDTHVILFSCIGFLLLFEQILIGLFLGFVAQFLFVTVNLAGEIISLQMGLSFATFFNKNISMGSSIISRLLNIFVLLFFLIINAHLYLISMLVDSFYKIPIDGNFLNKNIFFTLLQFSNHIFIDSILFATPVMIILLSIGLIMSILNRLAPQISIFSIGFPLNLLVGLFVLYSLTSVMFSFFENLFQKLILFIFHTF